jgi:hypothetical protein
MLNDKLFSPWWVSVGKPACGAEPANVGAVELWFDRSYP